DQPASRMNISSVSEKHWRNARLRAKAARPIPAHWDPLPEKTKQILGGAEGATPATPSTRLPVSVKPRRDATIRAGSPKVRAKRCAARRRRHRGADATSGTLPGAVLRKSAYAAAVAFSAGREWADRTNSSAGRLLAPRGHRGKSSAASGCRITTWALVPPK